MAITCVRNFICNGVHGAPGKELSGEEVAKIGGLLSQLNQEGLVMGSADAVEPSQPNDQPELEASAPVGKRRGRRGV